VSALVELSEVHRITIEEYHQLVAGGWLNEDARVELIDGVVVDMRSRSPQHEAAISFARGREVAPVAIALAPLNTEGLFATPLGERE
jgi:hypothetical protein